MPLRDFKEKSWWDFVLDKLIWKQESSKDIRQKAIHVGENLDWLRDEGNKSNLKTDEEFQGKCFMKLFKVLVAHSYPTLCDPMDCSPAGSSVNWILQARILECDAISFSRASSWPRDGNKVSARRHILYHLSHRDTAGQKLIFGECYCYITMWLDNSVMRRCHCYILDNNVENNVI